MSIPMPAVVRRYVEASNRHEVDSILSCFSDDAAVRDEGREYHGKNEIRNWIVKTIEQYNFHFKPVSVDGSGAEIAFSIEVSGTFPGSPVTPDYRFTISENKISSLAIS